MPAPPGQEDVAAFLRALAGSDPLETHISLVFIGPDTVWKLKKAVRLAFLDFTSLDSRRRFTLRELELNQPAAPGLYRDAVPVVRRTDGTLAFGETDDAAAIDWVLRMARVPSDDFLDEIAAAEKLTPPLLDALGDTVALFHASLSPVRGAGPAASMRSVALGNAQSALDAGLPESNVREWRKQIGAALDAIASWLGQRGRDGFVRRAHGDLHLGNLCLWNGKPVPFDALEFDEAMATIDLGYDLAFLLMDLDRRVSRGAANRVLNRYVARTGDAALTQGLPAFLSLRAMIRAHVEAKRGNPGIAAPYLAAALDYLRPKRPIVLAIGGLPGTGKTTLARALAAELGRAPGALVLRSDEIRKRQHKAPPEQRLPQSAYGEAASEAVLAELAARVGETASGGHAVVADATFIDPRHRSMLAAAARAAAVPFVGLWLHAPLAVLEARIAARHNDASDATIAVLRAASQGSPGPGDWIPVEADEPAQTEAHARIAIQPYQSGC
jgi:aminoglycoside phosphotransferase family enzyme/predicted kinase